MSDELISGWLDGELSTKEQEEFDRWLLKNPEAMQRVVEAAVRDEQLRDAANEQSTVESVRERANVLPMPRQNWKGVVSKVAAIAAVLVLAGILMFQRGKVISVKVLVADDASVRGISKLVDSGFRELPKRLQLETGLLELALSSGVRLELHAPLVVEFESSMRLRLLEGRLNADVGDRGKGFTVLTEAGRVVDLGTKFGVEVNGIGESRVAVFSGSVEFHPNQTNDFITLTEGMALQFSARAGLRRWEQIALEAEKAGLSSAPISGVLESVRDNLGDGEIEPFYGVVSQGMRPGALAFTDKPNPQWQAYPGESFPDEILGADLVRTYYRFRNKKNYELTLTLRQPATVYLFQDIRNDPPEWLRQRFKPTGSHLRVGPWHQAMNLEPGIEPEPEGPFLRFAVWQTEAAPGELRLGRPGALDSGKPTVMYGLAVKATSNSSNHD